MGTRSTVTILSEQGDHLVSLYIQFDGYPSGVGQKLADFLGGKKLVNGYGDATSQTQANGMGCLAAQLIAHLKDGIGNVYVTEKGDSQEYNYTISVVDGKYHLKCESEYDGLIYSGLYSDFDGAVVEANMNTEEELD